MRRSLPFACSVAALVALFAACSSDNVNVGGAAKDASTGGDSSSAGDGGVAQKEAGSGEGGGTASDAGDASNGDDAGDAGDDAGADASFDGSDVDASFDGSPPGDAGVDPTFTNVYAIIINGTCTGCHAAVMPSGKLDMSSQAAAYAHLVNVNSAGPACGVKAEPRVLPNDHAGSLIWNKINGTQNCGSRMPLGGGALSQDKIDIMAQWIDLGALDN